MPSKALFKLFTKNLFLFLLLFIFSYEQQCILGKNCPVNQGMCVSDICVCNEGYYTLLDKSTPANLLIYCNYKKISQYTPIVTEIFLPSLGHFIVGNYWLGILKISLILAYLLSSYYLYKKVSLPSLFKKLFEKIGISTFLEESNVTRQRTRQDTQRKLFVKKIFHVSSTLISLMYFADLFFYKFGVYTDGNGVPFV